jgi:hypothetical protein
MYGLQKIGVYTFFEGDEEDTIMRIRMNLMSHLMSIIESGHPRKKFFFFSKCKHRRFT